jgi:ATP-binding cassette subfamily B protein
LTLCTVIGLVTANRLVGLWRIVFGFRTSYLGATLSLGLAAASKTASFLLLRYFVDTYLAAGKVDHQALPLIALGFVALALFEGVFTFWSGRLAARTAEGVALRLRNLLFDHVQRLSFTYHDQTKTGDLIQRSTSDVDTIRRFFADQAIGIGRIIVLFTINLLALLTIHWQLALASIIVVPLVGVMSVYFFRRISKSFEAFQEQEAVLSTTLQENLAGVRVVKAFARQGYERDKFEKDNQEKYRRGRHLIGIHAYYWPLSDLLTSFQVLVILFIAATMVIDGGLTVGSYLAFAGVLWSLIGPIRNLGRLVIQMSEGLVSFDRVSEVLRNDLEPLDVGEHRPNGHLRGEIEFKNVTFAYAAHRNAENGNKKDENGKPANPSSNGKSAPKAEPDPKPDLTVLSEISFRAEPGQVVALLGSTGSGKTSLVNLLPRFYDYTGGSLLLDGVELNKYPRHTLRKQIGIVEQEPFLFSRSIRENIAYGVGRDVTDAEVEAAARAAAIHDSIMSFPEGYKTVVGEKGVTLSGGQKQRVAIARTLLKDPRILILDDATSSVDTETEAEIREALNQLMQGRTSFIIAHRIQSVMIADLILVLDKGRIVQHGTHSQLMAQPDGIYRRIYDMQSRIEDELEKELASVVPGI